MAARGVKARKSPAAPAAEGAVPPPPGVTLSVNGALVSETLASETSTPESLGIEALAGDALANESLASDALPSGGLPGSALDTSGLISSVLSSRALYWRLRYNAHSTFLGYMPFLFWLVEASLPNVTVALGVNAAVPYFGVCQAVDKLGLGSTCFGFDPAALDDEIVAHNRQFYGDFSQIEAIGLREAATRIGKARVDLLLVNLPVDEALIALLDTCWLPLLSDSGIVLFSAGVKPGAESDYAAFVERLGAKAGFFLFGQPDHVAFALCGDHYPDRLRHLTQLQLGQAPYLQVRQVFERLGESYAQGWRLAALATEAEREREARVVLATALDDKAREVVALQAQLAALQAGDGGIAALEARLAAQDSWVSDLETLVMEAEVAAAAEKSQKMAALAALKALEDSQMAEPVAAVPAAVAQVYEMGVGEEAAALAVLAARLAETEALLQAQAGLVAQRESDGVAFEARLAASDLALQEQTALVGQRERDLAALATLLEAMENSPASEPAEAPVLPGVAELEAELAGARSQCDVALKHLERLTFENAALKSRVMESHGDLHDELLTYKAAMRERERDIAALGQLLSDNEASSRADKAGAPVPAPAALPGTLLPVELDSIALTLAEYVETIDHLAAQLAAAEARGASVPSGKNADYLAQETSALKTLNATLSNENADLRNDMAEIRAGLELELALHQHEITERETDIAALGNLLSTLEKSMMSGGEVGQSAVPQAAGPDPRIAQTRDSLAASQARIAEVLAGSQFSPDYLALRPVLDEQVFAISRSGQFDVAWFRKAYPGTTGLLYDILRQFVRKGTFAGENPGPGFDTLRYYIDYPEVAEAGLCAFAHYLMQGKAEGRIAHRVEG